MNKKQKILTIIAIIALIPWGIMLSDELDMERSKTWTGSSAGNWAALLVMVLIYVGLFFVLKAPKAK